MLVLGSFADSIDGFSPWLVRKTFETASDDPHLDMDINETADLARPHKEGAISRAKPRSAFPLDSTPAIRCYNRGSTLNEFLDDLVGIISWRKQRPRGIFIFSVPVSA